MSMQMVPIHSPEERGGSENAALSRGRFICFGAFQLDLKKEELSKDGARIKLRGKVYQALLTLLQRPGELVTREELRRQLWPSDTYVNFDANMNTTVNKLRQILGDSPEQPVFVETIPRKGYSFIAKIDYVNRLVTPQARTEELSPAVHEREEAKASIFPTALLSRWIGAVVVAIVIASMLFAAAIVLYAHH